MQTVAPPTWDRCKLVAARVQDAAGGIDVDSDGVGRVGGACRVSEKMLIQHAVLTAWEEGVRVAVLPHDPCRQLIIIITQAFIKHIQVIKHAQRHYKGNVLFRNNYWH